MSAVEKSGADLILVPLWILVPFFSLDVLRIFFFLFFSDFLNFYYNVSNVSLFSCLMSCRPFQPLVIHQ